MAQLMEIGHICEDDGCSKIDKWVNWDSIKDTYVLIVRCHDGFEAERDEQILTEDLLGKNAWIEELSDFNREKVRQLPSIQAHNE